MKFSLIVYILIAIIPLNALRAQVNFQKGVVVTKAGDTINGLIDYREWEENPAFIKFKFNDSTDNTKILTPNDVSYFQVDNRDYFESHNVSVSLNMVAPLERLSRNIDTIFKKDIVFLRLLAKGKALDLYSYSDNLKVRYYIKEQGQDTIVELLYSRYFSPQSENKLITDRRKAQLNQVASKQKSFNAQKFILLLGKADYIESDLLPVVACINGSSNKEYYQKAKPDFYVGLSLYSSKAKYNGADELAINANGKLSLFPALSTGLIFSINPAIKKLAIKIDLTIGASMLRVRKDKGHGYISHSFNRYFASFNPMVIYNFYNSSNLKFNVGTGLSGVVSMYKNSVYTMDYTAPGSGLGSRYDSEKEIKLEPFAIAVPIRAGLILKNKFDIYAQYNIPVSPITSYLFYSIRVQSAQLGMNFLF